MWAKALVLVNPTVLEVILQDLFASAELLQFPYYGLDPLLRRPRGFRQCRAPSWLESILSFSVDNTPSYLTMYLQLQNLNLDY